MIKKYDSIAALRADAIQLGVVSEGASYSSARDHWYGNETAAETLRFSETGDTSLVPEAEKLLASIETGVETPRRMWERSPAGAFCVVPDVLAGLPTPMRRMAHFVDEVNPINILVTTTSSAGVSAKTLSRRGTAILALVLAMSRIRPVSLQQITLVDGYGDGTGETIILGHINTSPLDLATACYVLTSSGFSRRLTYGLAKKLNRFNGGWPRSFVYRNPEPFYKALIPRLGMNPKDTLLIGGAKLDDTLLRDPIGWVNDQITRFTTRNEED